MKAIPTCRSPLRNALPGALGVLALAVSAAAAMVMIGDVSTPLANAAAAPLSFGLPAPSPAAADETGYPALVLDANGNVVAQWFFEAGTRDNIGYNRFLP